MRPDQLGDFRLPSDVQLHPTNDKAAFVVAQMNTVEDVYVHTLWMWNGADAFPVTPGVSDTSPRWSPDGQTLAYLSKGSDHEAKPHIATRGTTGQTTPLISFELGVKEIAWSPDGMTIAAVVPEYVDGLESEEDRERAPRRITAPAFRYDNNSWMYNRRSHIWLIDVATGDATKLTSGDSSEAGPAWSPDGGSISYVSATDPRRWIDDINHVFTVSIATAEVVQRSPAGSWTWCGYAPNGSLLVVGVAGEKPSLRLPQLARVELDGSLSQLSSLDQHIVGTGQAGSGTNPMILSNESVACLVENRGAQELVEIRSGNAQTLISGKRVVSSFGMRPESAEVVFSATTPTDPGELHRIVGSAESILTDLNVGFVSIAGLVEPQEFVYESDGSAIHGWVYLPEGEGPLPLLFNIHGGPAAQYSWGFFDEFQVYAGAGYGVVAVNPRGSSGYGYDHVAAPIGRWAEDVPPDFLDLKSAPYEAAARFPRLDLGRMGILGGSYGGLSTVVLTSMDQRYKSAVAERGVYNFVSFAGTTDIPWFGELYLQATMPTGVDDVWAASPLARAHAITTPTLVLHSEDDFRCPLEQGQQLFTLLYTKGVETELLLFPPGEGHELSRSGKPKHRVERFDAIIEWHDRFLKV
ncbi:MAG: S9 family peptidase [Actinomycetota bacterium]|nr:S9 family peptidase [Actinomycetota bacterium]